MPDFMTISAADTLQPDAAVIETWRADGRYDYTREMMQSDSSVSEWLQMQITDLLNSIFGSRFYTANETVIWTFTGLVGLAVLLWLVWRKRPSLFGSSGKASPISYDVSEDTIYGIDFQTEIDTAMLHADYRSVVRLAYLHVLKEMEDIGRIIWMPHKTPSEYAAEVNTPEFRMFSNTFLRIRYGNFAADRQTAEEMLRQRDSIIRRTSQDAKGGET